MATFWNQLWDDTIAWLSDADMWQEVAISAGRIIFILVASRLILWIANRLITRSMTLEKNTRLNLPPRRVLTLTKLLRNFITYAVNFIVVMLVLNEFNIHLWPLVAGAGVIGLAIGFGAQSLVKDVITGFFVVLEDQFAVGDVIQTGTYKGRVELIGLRSTRLLSTTGEVHIIPNGMINQVTNYSLHNAQAIIDVSIAYHESVEQASRVVTEALEQLKDPNLINVPQLLGVQAMTATDYTLRISAECLANTENRVTRVINAHIKLALEAAGIERKGG